MLEQRRLPATFTVASVADDASPGTLRWAVLSADSTGGSNTVAFDSTVFDTPRTIALAGGELVLTSGTVTIDGPGAGLLTISGEQVDRIFLINPGVTAAISGLTISGGSATTGGGLFNLGTATLAYCTIRDNEATNGGAIYDNGKLTLTGCTIGGNSARYGGGLWNRGTANLIGCSLIGNSAYMGGGLVNDKYGRANLTSCTISGNSASLGGGLSNYGQANLIACTISGNTAVNATANPAGNPGGGIYNYSNNYGGKTTLVDTVVAGNAGYGGAASDIGGNNSTSVIGTNDLIGSGGSGGIVDGQSGNIVMRGPDGLDLAPLGDYGGPTPTMPPLPGSPAIGTAASVAGLVTDQRGFAIDSPVDIGAVQAVAVPLVVAVATDGTGAPFGQFDLRGAADLASIQSVSATITFDPAVFATARTIALTAGPIVLGGTGGTIAIDGPAAGLMLSGGGTARVLQVDPGATATVSGLTISGGSATVGGGVYNQGMLTIANCTISGNTASGNGGGLASYGTLSLVECTVTGNTAGGGGGGLFNDAQASLIACTISGNAAGGGGGGLYEGNAGSDAATLGNSIVAGNTGAAGSASDIGGTDAANVVGTYNLVGTGGSGGISGGSGGNIVLTSLANLGLAAPGSYGGPTPTIALLPGCPAIDAGSDSLIPAGVSTDQRGEPRIVGGAVDIGAFESQGFTLTPAAGSTPQTAATGTSFADPLALTVSASNPAEPVIGGVVTFTVNPSGGAGASLSAGSATIAAIGSVWVTATANSVAGQYTVTAATTGAAPVSFNLTNQHSIGFSGLSDQSIVYGTASATFSGTIADGSSAPAGEDVTVTLDGVTQQAAIGSDGSFSATFDTASLGVAGSPYTVDYAYAGDGIFPPASQTTRLTVTPATPILSVVDPGGTYDGSPFAATASVAGVDGQPGPSLEGVGLTLSYYAGSTASGTPLGGPPSAAGTYTVLASFAGSADFTAASAQATFVIAPATPAITWAAPGSIVYGTALGSAQLDATASVSGTFAYNPAAGTVLGAGTQTLSLTFTPTDSTDYTPATATISLTVTQATPAVTWSSPAAITYGTPLGPGQLDATASVPGSFSYAPAAGTILGAGIQTLSVTFTPTDSTDYTAPTMQTSLTVNPAIPSITWSSPLPIVYGTALGDLQLDATANVPGSFRYSPAAGTVLGAGTQTLSLTFTPTDSTDYTPATATTSLTVTQTTPAITWNSPAAITYGTPLGSAQLDASTSVAGTFTYNPPAGTILDGGTHTLSVTFNPTDSVDYTTATATTMLTVGPATPAITWSSPAAITYGTPLGPGQLDAIASVPGSFSYNPAAGTIVGAGNQVLSMTFTPTDSTDYTMTNATATITVEPAAATVDVSGGGVYDGSPIPATATVTGVVPGVDAAPAPSLEGVAPGLTYYAGSTATGSPLPGAPIRAGTYTVVAGFPGSADYTAATAVATFTIARATPSVAWSAPAPIVYGTALGSAQLDATADVPGSFAYDPAAGTVPGAGTHALSVTFTPVDAANESTAAASTSMTVSRATPVVGVRATGGVYDGSPFAATGIVSGIAGAPAASLEGVVPGLTYYAGTAATRISIAGPPTMVGTYTVVAVFPGSADYASASSGPVTFDITAPSITVTLESSAASTVFGQSVTLTAAVSLALPGAAVAVGTIAFLDGSQTLASVPLDASGHAILTTTSLSPGGHTITAAYDGGAREVGARSAAVTESVSASETRVILVPHTVRKGKRLASLSLTAEVEALAPGGGIPTGTVSFKLRKRTLATMALSGGQATLPVKPSSILNRSIRIIYSGTNEFQAAALASPRLTSRSLAAISHRLSRVRRSRLAIQRLLPRVVAKGGHVHASSWYISRPTDG